MASGSKSVDITGYDTSDCSYYSVSSIDNCYAGSSNTSYGQVNLTRGYGGITYIYFTFGSLSNIPANATINTVSCSAKCSCYYSNSRVSLRQMQLYTGTTAKGTAYSFTTSATSASSAVTVDAGNSWTIAELQNARLKLYAVRGTSGTNTNYYFRFYGATLSVTYTYQSVTYTITATSNVSDVTITPATQSISSGENATITLSGLYKGLVLTDNNTDVTSSISSSGTYTISNVSATHNVDISLPVNGRLFCKDNGTWKVVNQVFSKSNTWSASTNYPSIFDTSQLYIREAGYPTGIIDGARLTIYKMWADPNYTDREVNVLQMAEICLASTTSIDTTLANCYNFSNSGTTYTATHVNDTTGTGSGYGNELPDKAFNYSTSDKMCIHLYSSRITSLSTINSYLASDPAVITWSFPNSTCSGSTYKNVFFITGNDNSGYPARTPRHFSIELHSDNIWYPVVDFNYDSDTIPQELRQDYAVIPLHISNN